MNFQNAYIYDAASNRTSLTAPDNSVTTYGYDTLNRLNGLGNTWAGSFGFGYDALSRRTSLTRPNGVNTSYSYDSVSHLLSVLHQAGNTTLDGASYTYDPAGNRNSKTNYLNGVTSNYGYDLLYQLAQVTQGTSTTESYSYDAVGNRLSSLGVPNYNYNSSNELTSNSNGSYTYDNNGNTLADAQGRSFTWDFENRLTQTIVPGTNGGTTTFKYDPFGRRIQKSGPLGTINYLYDGMNAIQDVDGVGNILAKYTQGKGIDEPLAESLSTITNYYEQDALRSVTSLSSASGALSNTYSYDSFGNLSGSTGTVTNRFRYTGRELDQESGVYFYRARYFDPSAGRFLSEDPIQFIGGNDFYSYVLNDPTGFRDALGLCPPKEPWDRRANVVKLLRAKNPCSDWFNKGQGSAPDIMSKVPILLGNPTPGPLSGPDADTYPDATSPITVYSDGRFFPDSKSGIPVGGVADANGNYSGGFPPGSYGAQMIILLHELAHKTNLIPDDKFSPYQSQKNTKTVMDHCADAVTASAP